MKITLEHYNHIKKAIEALPREKVLAHKEQLITDGNYKDLNTRFMYDVQRAAGLLSFVCDTIYKYADDSHYQTALFKAGKELKLID